ncbi:MAG: hypothetical protein EZS28_043300, partial [Streblomastix strix]
MTLTTMLSRAPKILLVNPIAAEFFRPGLFNFSTQNYFNRNGHKIGKPRPMADTMQREKNTERSINPWNIKQMDVIWERSPPSLNFNTQIGEGSKGWLPRLKERMSKDLVEQHRKAWDQEGYDLVDQKSRHSDPPPTGYAEGKVQIRQFIDALNKR